MSELPRRDFSVCILPETEELPNQDQTRIETFAVIPDGNNRDGGDYDRGGDNVIQLAEKLLSGDEELSTLFACVLSPDNIDKRSQEFFEKLRLAFVMLGVRMLTKGTLWSKGILLGYTGDLERLRARGGCAASLADTMEAVRDINNARVEAERSKQLLLGIDYPLEALEEIGADLVYRSGMEETGVGRFGSMEPDASMLLAADTTLWPNVTEEQLRGLLTDARRQVRQTFSSGFSMDAIEAMWTALAQALSDYENVTVTIPHEGTEIEEDEQQRPKEVHPDGSLTFEFPSRSGRNELTIVPDFFDSSRSESTSFDAFIVPGQIQRCFQVPDSDQIKVDYANVFQCEADSTSIAARAADAVEFSRTHQSLKGAERKVIYLDEHERPEELPEYQLLLRTKVILDKHHDMPVEEIAAKIQEGNDPDFENHDLYSIMAILFAAKTLECAKAMHAPLETPHQFRAAMNYALVSYLIANHPQHPEWDWKTPAYTIAKYMELVYTGDAAIFDKTYGDEEAKERIERLRQSSEFLIGAVQNPEEAHECPEIPGTEILENIAKHWRIFMQRFEKKSHPLLLKQWKDALTHLYQCGVNEYESSVTDNPLVNGQRSEIDQRYLEGAPESARIRLNTLLDTIESEEDPAQIEKARRELRVWMYLFDISSSIGSGLVYRTAALCVDPEEATDERIAALDAVCTLSDLSIRLGNDLSGYFRTSEFDPKKDACDIMIEEHRKKATSEAKAVIHGISELKELYQYLAQIFIENLHALEEKWPYIGNIVSRGYFAGIEIYKESHFEDLPMEKMLSHYFRKINKSSV